MTNEGFGTPTRSRPARVSAPPAREPGATHDAEPVAVHTTQLVAKSGSPAGRRMAPPRIGRVGDSMSRRNAVCDSDKRTSAGTRLAAHAGLAPPGYSRKSGAAQTMCRQLMRGWPAREVRVQHAPSPGTRPGPIQACLATDQRIASTWRDPPNHAPGSRHRNDGRSPTAPGVAPRTKFRAALLAPTPNGDEQKQGLPNPRTDSRTPVCSRAAGRPARPRPAERRGRHKTDSRFCCRSSFASEPRRTPTAPFADARPRC